MLFTAALRAYRDAVRPAQQRYGVDADLLIAEVPDGFAVEFWASVP